MFEIAVYDPDVVSANRARPKTLELDGMTMSVDALQDENGPSPGPKARVNASITPKGFLRSKTLSKSKANRTR